MSAAEFRASLVRVLKGVKASEEVDFDEVADELIDMFEAEERMARMAKAGHGPYTDEEKQATLDETLLALERDP